MKVVFKDLKSGEIKIIPENLDDIWHLYNIIEVGDLVRGVSYRTDEQKDDKKRQKKAEKKRMKLGVRVEKVSFHEFSDRLRIHGTIEEGPQDLGSYHTLNVDAEKMDKISIVKKSWLHHDLQRIDEAVHQSGQALLVFVSLDEDTATIALLRQSGVQWIADVDSKRSGKMYESKSTEHDYYQEVVTVITSYVKEDSPLVVIGPGFTRQHLITYGKNKNPELFKSCFTHATGNAGMNGIHEAVKSGVVDQITKNNRVSYEVQLVEKVFTEIKKEGVVVYGEQEVFEALQKGAVQHLLISDVNVRSKGGEKLLRIARETQSDFTIINTIHDEGKKFEGIGGVAAFLRFKV